MYKLVTTAEEFDNIVNDTKYKHIIVNFGTTFCRTCKIFQPVYEEVAKDERYRDMAFIKINADTNDDFDNDIASYNISKYPTIIILDQGSKETHYSPYICSDTSKDKFEGVLSLLLDTDLGNVNTNDISNGDGINGDGDDEFF